MHDWKLQAAVAFFVFNRPDKTEKVFEAIRVAKPSELLVVADGPRENHFEDIEKCKEVREIIERVDWDCEILKNYADKNMGCKKRVSSGLDWVFEQVEEAIILEDDTLPHPSFFRFCEELLCRYRDDKRIMMISGDNFQFGVKRDDYSYYFSRYCHIWGWASWRRAWRHYDVDMKSWPEVRDNKYLEEILNDKKLVRYWNYIFEKMYKKEIDTWDYQWTYACLMQNALTILPNHNLVSNIGFGVEGTHTLKSNAKHSNLPSRVIRFPLMHPKFLVFNARENRQISKNFDILLLMEKVSIKRLLKKYFKG